MNKRTVIELRDIEVAANKLANSKSRGDRLDARHEFRKLVRAYADQMLAKHPRIKPDGQVARGERQKSYDCPVCKRYNKDIRELVDHLYMSHHVHGQSRDECLCGYKGRGSEPWQRRESLRRHLGAQRDLKQHLATHWLVYKHARGIA